MSVLKMWFWEQVSRTSLNQFINHIIVWTMGMICLAELVYFKSINSVSVGISGVIFLNTLLMLIFITFYVGRNLTQYYALLDIMYILICYILLSYDFSLPKYLLLIWAVLSLLPFLLNILKVQNE